MFINFPLFFSISNSCDKFSLSHHKALMINMGEADTVILDANKASNTKKKKRKGKKGRTEGEKMGMGDSERSNRITLHGRRATVCL